MIKGVFFDVGGVLQKGEIEIFYKALCEKLGLHYERFMDLHSRHKKDLMAGKMQVSGFAKEAEKEFGIDCQYPCLWKEVFLEALPINADTLEIARRLSKKFIVGIISNAMDEYEMINSERELYKGFNPVILSCRCGFFKPQKEIFELALKAAGLNAEECVFIDDREKLLETPKEMGFKTILFKDSTQLESELKDLNLI
ncbi:MAG: HAD family phosphatase [Candidatus Aenigmarchaeota archaeon]|nr:HAD family phosphatase [Candidatus Aenigmarchaeota archaeon]